MRGLWNLTWLEIKIFVREPLGFLGAVIAPVLIFVALGRTLGGRAEPNERLRLLVGADLPVFAVMIIALNAVLSLFATVSILSIGFLVASLVPTARFAQPVGTLLLYPMLGVSGLFVPLDAMPPAVQSVSQMLPLTYAVSLLRGIWLGESWMAHGADVAGLTVVFVVCTALSSRVFRWE